jgi:hypothetical protein
MQGFFQGNGWASISKSGGLLWRRDQARTERVGFTHLANRLGDLKRKER